MSGGWALAVSEKGIPAYQRIAAHLMEKVRAGQYAIGSRLPGELELREQFGVSRHTIREALRLLETGGYVSRTKGVGTVVRRNGDNPTAGTDPALTALNSFLRTLSSEVIEPCCVAVDGATADRIGFPRSAGWIRVNLLRRDLNDQAPVCLSEMFLPERLRFSLDNMNWEAQPLYQRLLDVNGDALASMECEFRTEVVDSPRFEAIGLLPGDVALNVVRRYHGFRSGIFLATSCTHATGSLRFQIDYHA